jgi:tryptophan-rich sensory protein
MWNGWSNPMPNRWISWIVFVAICFGAAAVGAWFTNSSVKTWYPGLLKPAGTPPSWVFGPVWSALYLLMGTAAWLVWQEAHDVRLPLGLFFCQLLLNAAWSLIFFGMQRPGLALVEILILLLAIVLTAMSFLGCSRPAFWMLTPYLGWVGYATYLNVGIWRLNRGAA